MTYEIAVTFFIIVIAVYLFATEKLPVDLVALSVMGILLISGLISADEGVSGFSNPATVTVAAMFVLSAGLQKTGAVLGLASMVTKLFTKNFWLALFVTMVVVGVVSAFINNTPVIAIFVPILLNVAMVNNVSISKLLMPISFASMFGGVCTLIGTSTNILVSSIAVNNGLEPFGMFEFTPLGLIFFAGGLIYMFVLGIHLIPDRRKEKDLTSNFQLKDYITDIILLEGAPSIGKPLLNSPIVQEVEIDVLEVIRNKKRLPIPPSKTILQVGDILRVRCDIKEIQKIKERIGVKLVSDYKWKDADLETEDVKLVEAIISPNAELIGKSLKTSDFRTRFQATAMALRHRGKLMQKGFAKTPLAAGDAILLEVKTEQLERIRNNPNFVVITDVPLAKYRKDKILIAFGIVAGVILFASLGIAPILVTAIVGALLLVLTKCITLQDAYQSIDWKVIFLLGGILSLGIALEKTGAALLLSNFLLNTMGWMGPVAIVGIFYLLTSLLTETMSNNATAVLLAPIAISTANTLGIDPKPLLMAVTFAASASFMTPVGYQTNTMIYGVGQYKFSDFMKVGAPLNIIFFILAVIFIPYFFPF